MNLDTFERMVVRWDEEYKKHGNRMWCNGYLWGFLSCILITALAIWIN